MIKIKCENKCPHCGSDKIVSDPEYFDIANDNKITYEYHCYKCSKDFKATYKLIYEHSEYGNNEAKLY